MLRISNDMIEDPGTKQKLSDKLAAVDASLADIVTIKPTGTDDTVNIQNAINQGKKIKLTEGTFKVSSQLSSVSSEVTIEGIMNKTVIQLTTDFSLVNLDVDRIKLSNLKILVPITNAQPVILFTLTAFRRGNVFENITIDTVGTTLGNFIGIKVNTQGKGFYENIFRNVKINNCNIGLNITGTASGWATGNDLNGIKFENYIKAIQIDTIDFSNNHLQGQFFDGRTVDTTGLEMDNGWGNTLDFEGWYDSSSGRFINLNFGSTTHHNIIKGHYEGEILDSGYNIYDVWWQEQNKTTGMAITNNRYKTSNFHNLLSDGSFESSTPSKYWAPNFSQNGVDISTAIETTNIKDGVQSFKITRLSSNYAPVYQSLGTRINAFKGKYVTFGAWVMCPATNAGVMRIAIETSSSVDSKPIPNDGKWHWMNITKLIETNATGLIAKLASSVSGDILTANDILYVDGAVAVVGAEISSSFITRIREITYGTPASATDTGEIGIIKFDGSYLYVCTGSNTWKRTAIASW